MVIEPLRPRRAQPVAILEPGIRRLRVTSLNGTNDFVGRRDVEKALAGMAGAVCYAHGGLADLRHTTGARSWVLYTWRGRETRMRHVPTGVVVTSLRHTLYDHPDPYPALLRVIDWLAVFGVTAGSLSAMAWRLLRASLNGPVRLGVDPFVGFRALYGPRQTIRDPGVYHDQMHVDMRAAYPSSMAARPYALSLREVDKHTTIDPNVAGIAAATVKVPSFLGYPPLPTRVMQNAIQFRTGQVKGFWPWCELAAAADMGCDVDVAACWAPRRELDLFDNWWSMAATGRELDDVGDLPKAIANTTWGQFAMSGDQGGEVHWVDDKGDEAYSVPVAPRQLPHRWTAHVAAETTARVRRRLLDDVLTAPVSTPVHVDTDGIICSWSSKLPRNSGDGFGQWSVRMMMDTVDVRAPQLLRYTCPDCEREHAKWHFVASGMAPDVAANYFRHHRNTHTAISYLAPIDANLPSSPSWDRPRIDRLIAQAQVLGVR